jgi:dATP pyrophosphohydrolase
MRAPYQVLVIPYTRTIDGQIKYCVFKREDMKVWQGIAGGGEDGETPHQTAIREAHEEAGVSLNSKIIQLSSVCAIPVVAISGFVWGEDVLVIPEYSFGVELMSEDIVLSNEHLQYEWLSYEETKKRFEWDSNRTALWELDYRLTHNKIDTIRNLYDR